MTNRGFFNKPSTYFGSICTRLIDNCHYFVLKLYFFSVLETLAVENGLETRGVWSISFAEMHSSGCRLH